MDRKVIQMKTFIGFWLKIFFTLFSSFSFSVDSIGTGFPLSTIPELRAPQLERDSIFPACNEAGVKIYDQNTYRWNQELIDARCKADPLSQVIQSDLFENFRQAQATSTKINEYPDFQKLLRSVNETHLKLAQDNILYFTRARACLKKTKENKDSLDCARITDELQELFQKAMDFRIETALAAPNGVKHLERNKYAAISGPENEKIVQKIEKDLEDSGQFDKGEYGSASSAARESFLSQFSRPCHSLELAEILASVKSQEFLQYLATFQPYPTGGTQQTLEERRSEVLLIALGQMIESTKVEHQQSQALGEEITKGKLVGGDTVGALAYGKIQKLAKGVAGWNTLEPVDYLGEAYAPLLNATLKSNPQLCSTAELLAKVNGKYSFSKSVKEFAYLLASGAPAKGLHLSTAALQGGIRRFGGSEITPYFAKLAESSTPEIRAGALKAVFKYLVPSAPMILPTATIGLSFSDGIFRYQNTPKITDTGTGSSQAIRSPGESDKILSTLIIEAGAFVAFPGATKLAIQGLSNLAKSGLLHRGARFTRVKLTNLRNWLDRSKDSIPKKVEVMDADPAIVKQGLESIKKDVDLLKRSSVELTKEEYQYLDDVVQEVQRSIQSAKTASEFGTTLIKDTSGANSNLVNKVANRMIGDIRPEVLDPKTWGEASNKPILILGEQLNSQLKNKLPRELELLTASGEAGFAARIKEVEEAWSNLLNKHDLSDEELVEGGAQALTPSVTHTNAANISKKPLSPEDRRRLHNAVVAKRAKEGADCTLQNGGVVNAFDDMKREIENSFPLYSRLEENAW